MTNNYRIGVFFGSGSVEHDISIITAQLIIAGLKGLKYQVTPVYVTKHGKWLIGEDLGNLKLFAGPNKDISQESSLAEYYLDLENSVGKLVFKKKGVLGKSVIVDLAFPALHGTYGEDGTIQGLFEMFGVSFVGCGVTASAVSMDKALTKQIYEQHKLPTTKFINFYKKDWGEKKESIIEAIKKLNWPVFVKPVHLGSSIAVAKVKDQNLRELENKIEVALHYDSKVLVEEGVEELMDITCCVLGNEDLVASKLQESVYTKDMFNFEDKYLKGGGAQTGKAKESVVIPARLDAKQTEEIQEMAKKVYKILECSGIARIDFLLNKKTNKYYVNEVNPLPGTLYHHLWKASGMELDELLQKLIKLAEEKHEQKKQTDFTFQSGVLSNLKGGKLGAKNIKV